MTAKMRSKPHRHKTRKDWEAKKVPVMRWCLRAKLVCNYQAFSQALLSTGDLPIVEMKRRGADFWGAALESDDELVGPNVLGRLLMELREEIKELSVNKYAYLPPLKIPDFLLFGEPIGPVSNKDAVRSLLG
jgi:predicted NAD-dependent protein-ADP-ribosyltransferase YbiA (DUF1768 family)